MTASSPEQTAPLLFNWGPPRARSLSLIGFVAASAVLHAVGFYLFQIVYPANVALLPPPARVALIAPTSEENRTLLRWVDAEDPALASATLRPPEARARVLLKVQHIPSYLSEEPKLKQIPPKDPDTRAPSSQPPGPVRIGRRQAGAAKTRTPTRILFSEELTQLGEVHLPAPQFAAASNEAPQAVRFRIAVNRNGEIRYCFPINSSGDAALDGRPSPAAPARDEPLIWGLATVEWGNDVAQPPLTTAPGSKP
jgi:hypothetical protein